MSSQSAGREKNEQYSEARAVMRGRARKPEEEHSKCIALFINSLWGAEEHIH